MFDYHSTKWRKVRTAVLRRDEYMCRECRRYGKTTAADTVHHILPADKCIGKRERLKYDSANLISLCTECHNKMHKRDSRELTDSGQDMLRRSHLLP